MSIRRFTGSILVMVVAAMTAAVLAPTNIEDNFNDNSLDTDLWRVRHEGGVTLRERHQRLDARADGETGFLSFHYLELRDWGINWKRNFDASIEYKIDIPAPPSDRFAAIQFALAFTEPNPLASGVSIAVIRADDGYWLAWFLFDDGDIIDFARKRLLQAHGTLELSWNKTLDRLSISAAGKTLYLDDLYQEYGSEFGTTPVIVRFGVGVDGGDMEFTPSQVNLDNFQFDGYTRPR